MSELRSFDIIICTCNREREVLKLLENIHSCATDQLKDIIVVDSSEQESENLRYRSGIHYIRSVHKNQPYQRFLGSSLSNSDIIFFMDDDIIIRDEKVFKSVMDSYLSDDIVGATPGILYENITLDSIKSQWGEKFKIPSFLSFIIGNYRPPAGRISYLGLSGPYTENMKSVQYFQGPFFSVKRIAFLKLFDPLLFSLYEDKLGKGEDKFLSTSLNKYGKMQYVNRISIYHPPIKSSYFDDLEHYFKRVSVSRYLLTMSYCNGLNKNLLVGKIIYIWFIFWRLTISLIQGVIKRKMLQKFYGYLYGFNFVFSSFFLTKIHHPFDWEKEIIEETMLHEKVSAK